MLQEYVEIGDWEIFRVHSKHCVEVIGPRCIFRRSTNATLVKPTIGWGILGDGCKTDAAAAAMPLH